MQLFWSPVSICSPALPGILLFVRRSAGVACSEPFEEDTVPRALCESCL